MALKAPGVYCFRTATASGTLTEMDGIFPIISSGCAASSELDSGPYPSPLVQSKVRSIHGAETGRLEQLWTSRRHQNLARSAAHEAIDSAGALGIELARHVVQ